MPPDASPTMVDIGSWSGFTRRIMAVLLGAGLLVGGLLTLFSIWEQKTHWEGFLHLRGRTLLRSLGRAAFVPLVLEDTAALDALAEGFKEEKYVVHVAIYRPDGQVLSQTPREENLPLDAPAPQDLTEKRLRSPGRGRIRDLTLPLRYSAGAAGPGQGEELSGYVRIGLTEEPVRSEIRAAIWGNLALCLGLTAAAFSAGAFLVRRMTLRMRDFLEQVQAAAAVERSQKELREYIDHMSTFNAKLDLDGNFILVNRTAQAATGLSEQELMMTPFTEGPWWTFDPQVHRRVRDAFRRALGGETINYDEKLFVYGRILTINFTLVPVRKKNGRVAYILAEGRDITPQKEAEEALRRNEESIRSLNLSLQERAAQLEASNKELEAFSYSVSHDLRAPLRSIDGFSQVLLEDSGGKLGEEGRDSLRRVRAATQRMSELIDDMLTLSRLTRQEMHNEPVDISEMAKAVLEDLRRAEPERKVETAVTSKITALGDKKLLRAVMENLLGNAWKFTAKKTPARIELGLKPDEDGRRVIFVKDNGAGFNMAYVHKLFGVFQRLHAAEDFPGTGVGLATVQRVIHRHGGRVWAESEVGRGATFHFTLMKEETP